MLKNQTFKPLNFFFIAANSLVATGLLTKSEQTLGEWLFLIWGGITGIFLTYRFNDFIDGHPKLEFDFKEFFMIRSHQFFTFQLLFILVPFSFLFLSEFRIFVLASSGFLGFLYSVNFRIGHIPIRLKNIFLLKNALIGVCWGSLVLVGADRYDHDIILSLFLFSTIQVLIGSSLRDFTDIKQDTIEYVRSLPVTIGESNALVVLGLLNILSGVISWVILGLDQWIVPMAVTILWRFFLLWKVYTANEKRYWCQKMNLLTCFIIFLGSFFIWIF